jgi:hypothetical protein
VEIRGKVATASAVDRYMHMPLLAFPDNCQKNEIRPQNNIQIVYGVYLRGQLCGYNAIFVCLDELIMRKFSQ